ncbi:SMR family transporter [Acinetobacter sp. A3.8]|uniref:Guanidinium exporter n=1 Tax=Acinetobacter sedimenti TaxID=2919922 RepID=A0A9X2BAD5_9GAMM|nr:SMR family transporter [Acinetobacter sedimenti]MCJ8146485.1 SMR family transporter [Acinetobacter sedimenti]
MAWGLLILAGILEIVWAYAMKLSKDFTILVSSVLTILLALASFALLAQAMKSITLGTAYVIWTGIGAIGAFLVGIFALGEPASLLRMLAAILIVSGMLLMKFLASA